METPFDVCVIASQRSMTSFSPLTYPYNLIPLHSGALQQRRGTRVQGMVHRTDNEVPPTTTELLGAGRKTSQPISLALASVATCASDAAAQGHGRPTADEDTNHARRRGRHRQMLPFRGQMPHERHPNDLEAFYTANDQHLVCPVCWFPEVHREAHHRGEVQERRSDIQAATTAMHRAEPPQPFILGPADVEEAPSYAT